LLHGKLIPRRRNDMRKFLAAALLVMGFSAVASAQITESRSAPPQPNRVDTTSIHSDGLDYSHSITGKVLRVNDADGSIVIEKSNGGSVAYFVDQKTRKRADKKTELAGKRDISLVDYKPGQVVRITYRIADNKALEVRLKQVTK
jgi:hypothetical protein